MSGELGRVSSGSPFEPTIGFVRAVRSGHRVLVSGTGPVMPDGSCPESALDQARRCFEIALDAVAEAADGVPTQVLRTRMYLSDRAAADEVGRAHAEVFAGAPPAATMVVVAGLLDPRWLVEVEVEAELVPRRSRVVGVGIDVVEIVRFDRALARTDGLRERLFVPAEASLPPHSLAARFAAKEALAKALGAPGNLEWHDAEVVTEESGRPRVELRGTVAARAADLGASTVHLSLSHDAGIASAVVVLER